jgi:predicted SAM-dependent methyltransferase
MLLERHQRNWTRYRNKQGALWLNIASSYLVLEDFVNLDNSPFLALVPYYPILKLVLKPGHLEILQLYRQARSKAVLLRHNCREKLKCPDGSVDHILCSHFLEHVYPDEAIGMIKEFHRVLKRRGSLHIIVPDLALLVDDYIQHKEKAAAADDLIRQTILTHSSRHSFAFRLFEFWGKYGLQHRWMYDTASMIHRLTNNGFRILEENNSPSAAFRLDDGMSAHVLGQKV